MESKADKIKSVQIHMALAIQILMEKKRILNVDDQL